MINIHAKFFLIFGFSILSTITFLPFIKKIGLSYNLVDLPNKRKLHASPTVRVGGLSLWISFFASSIFSYFLDWFSGNAKDLLMVYLLGSFLFFLVGFAEDIFKISMKFRLLLQVLISSLVWIQGVQIKEIDVSYLFPQSQIIYIPAIISFFITAFWIVAITNSFNWIDGLDGLSAGVAIITTFSLVLLINSIGTSSIMILMIALIGSCLGFLFFNFNPAKIFMGDGGSYLIGSLIAFFSIYSHNYFIENGISQLSFLWEFIILFVPIVDMNYVFFSRISAGESPFYPDRRHLHHRILRAGFSHRETVILTYLFCFFFSGIVFANVFKENNILIISFTSLTLFLFLLLKFKNSIILFKKFFRISLNKK